MSISAAHAQQFFVEVSENKAVWSIRDTNGFPTSTNQSGETAMPFWSSESRARKIIESVAAYSEFEPHKIPLAEFEVRWLPGLERDGLALGVNWSGERAAGYDMTPSEVSARLAAS